MEVVRGNYFLLNGCFFESQHINKYIEPKSIKIYEVFRVINSKSIFLDDHIERLKSSFLGINKHVSLEFYEDIKQDTQRLINKNNINEGNIKILAQFTEKRIQTFIYFIPHLYPPEQDYTNGIVVGVYEATRQNPNIKAASNVRDAIELFLRKKNLFEVLLIDEKGEITEGSRTNVFFIDFNNRIVTAPDNSVLKGVTRKYVIQLCKENNFYLSYQFVHKNDISKYKSIFLTGTSPKILPVKKIENITFETNSKELRKLMADYDSIIKDN